MYQQLPASQAVRQTASHPENQPASQPAKKSASQPPSQPSSQASSAQPSHPARPSPMNFQRASWTNRNPPKANLDSVMSFFTTESFFSLSILLYICCHVVPECASAHLMGGTAVARQAATFWKRQETNELVPCLETKYSSQLLSIIMVCLCIPWLLH